MALQDSTREPLPQLAQRQVDSHKGHYGRVLIVGGSRSMAGAPALAGRSALRSGAGLVSLAVPRSIQATVASFEAAYVTIGFGADDEDALMDQEDGEIITLAGEMTAIALGPGLGSHPRTIRLTVDLCENLSQPLVVDADALNALAVESDCLEMAAGPRVLTPHPGEFQRLTGEPCAKNLAARASQAAELCRKDSSGQTIVVLKGHQTILTDGERYAVNATGNPGMATGGSGDCLTGIIAALVGQGLSCWEAARLGVHVHGLAGDLAAGDLGQVSMTASDLVDVLPRAFQESATLNCPTA
ncbi:MAG: NAD(P)H-hydrate dehydratase [Pirellulales bacterium]|nr:NAD(P)H-hydrate dehydratase [Pirellulales bacterium]